MKPDVYVQEANNDKVIKVPSRISWLFLKEVFSVSEKRETPSSCRHFKRKLCVLDRRKVNSCKIRALLSIYTVGIAEPIAVIQSLTLVPGNEKATTHFPS